MEKNIIEISKRLSHIFNNNDMFIPRGVEADSRYIISINKKFFPECMLELYINYGPEYVIVDFVDMESHLYKTIYKENINNFNISNLFNNLKRIFPVYRRYINYYKRKIELDNMKKDYNKFVKEFF